MKTPGKGFLQVCGILMIIFGGIAVITTFASFAFNASISAFGAILDLISCILTLVTGILCVINCNKPGAAGSCLILAVLCIIVRIISIIFIAVTYGSFASYIFTPLNIFLYLLGFVLPVLVIIGSLKNKNASIA